MLVRGMIVLLLFIPFLWASPTDAAENTEEFCSVRILSEQNLQFSETERRWLCGDASSRGWQSIPNTQKSLFLKSFLQSRGYHSPELKIEKDVLVVNAGPRTTVQTLEIRGAPPSWDWKKRRQLQGRPFTPDTLTEVTKWARRRLQENSYACPQVKSEALIDEALYRLEVLPGPSVQFGFAESRGEEELNPEILDRFTAFFPDQDFDIRLLELTSNRVLQEDLYLSTYYDVLCDLEGNMSLVRRLIPAKPRLLTFGLGFDSEGGALFRSTIRQARRGPTANSLEASLYASLIEQTLTAKHRRFFASDLRSRLHLLSSFTVKHETEDSYESLTTLLGSSLVYGWESRDHRAQIQAGPYLERTDISVGGGPSRVETLRANIDATFTSHLYEYYLTAPQSGWTVSVNTSSQLQGALAQENVRRVTLQYQVLWNIQGWDPPLMILGWRGFFGSFFIDSANAEISDIPVTQRFFLGGDADLRGFGRKQIDGTGQGYLSALYQGLELRAGDVFPYKLQPLIFIDAALVGAAAAGLKTAIYYSPGIGLRWASPLGAVRSTLGRGFILSPEDDSLQPGYQLFFSFGREF